MSVKVRNNTEINEEQISRDEALKLYSNTLNFNVISRYDPAIKQLICSTSHCVVYRFNEETEEWNKTDYQGSLALYARSLGSFSQTISITDYQELFTYGLILLNRNNPDCFSIGLIPTKVSKQYLPNGIDDSEISEMDVELNDNLIIVRNLMGEIFGLWVFNEEDRQTLYKSIEFCLNNNDD
ncbi:DCP1 [Candida pseudojiufengensis]|uniref:DCP1 n=1 Tax=Candida pseudojiufengensis TaxID=497109 RepID=UPI002225A0C8|nr:DCP1 [Candida pseudojiufengensis]KAI5966298.1 DCP1 [Candida pseudojiufengensis]